MTEDEKKYKEDYIQQEFDLREKRRLCLRAI